MARPTEWRAERGITLSVGYQDLQVMVLAPGETVMRTVLTFRAIGPIADAPDPSFVGLAYALSIIDGDQAHGQAPTVSPWTDYSSYEDAMWWDLANGRVSLFQGNTSPAVMEMEWVPSGGTVDTRTMRTNATAGNQSLWFQTEQSDYAANEHQVVWGCRALVALVP